MRFLSVEHRGIEPATGLPASNRWEPFFYAENRDKRLNHALLRRLPFAAFSCIFAGRGGAFSGKRLHKGYTKVTRTESRKAKY